MLSDTKKLIIGSRASDLAKKQVEIFKKVFSKKFNTSSKLYFDVNYIKTTGDIVVNKKLSDIGNKGLFTKEIDNAQLRNEIDISIHSLKDLPHRLPKGLKLAGYLRRDDHRDALVSNENNTILKLKKNSIIGTSSIRREIQLRKIRPDLKIKLIRGNIVTRINKMFKGKYDGILLAMAGLKRLSITKNVKPIKIKYFVPAVGQGTIAIVTRKNDRYVNQIINSLSHKKTRIEVTCERAFLKGIDGSCQTPIGALAILTKLENRIRFNFFASSNDGKTIKKGEKFFSLNIAEKECYKLGKKISKILNV